MRKTRAARRAWWRLVRVGVSWGAALGAGAVAWSGRAAAAEPAPHTTRVTPYSPYEEESLQASLKDLRLSIDPAPQGKTFEGADVVTLEVLEERDPLQGFGIENLDGSKTTANTLLNALHTTSKHYVIAREVLLERGRPYEQALVDQTARNLRGLGQLSLVIVVPVRGTTPDKVRLLIITKDVWSLRVNSDIQASSGGLESLLVEPTESNLAGTHQRVFTRAFLLPKSMALGGGYVIPRLGGTHVAFSADANVVTNRDTGRAEGASGSASVGLPLYSLRQAWAWSVATSWSDTVLRRYVNARLATYDAKATPAVDDRIPIEYRGRRLTEAASVTRSFGFDRKNDVTFGAEINLREFRPGDLSRYDPAAAAEFVTRQVPVSDTRVGPFAQWRSYESRFLETLDVETLGLQEDFRLGYDVLTRVYPVTTALGSSRNFVGGYLGLQYTWPIGSGLLRVAAESTTEAESSRLSDASAGGHVRWVSPRFAFGRFVVDAAGQNRYRNYLNRQTLLGGNSRLRGYPSNLFVGKDWAAANAEYRTRPLEVLGSQLAGALFYDAGDAFNGFDALNLKQSVGVGFRFLFPQLDRFVLRGDVGFPLPPRDRGVGPVGFYLAFQQAFGFDSISGPPGNALGQ